MIEPSQILVVEALDATRDSAGSLLIVAPDGEVRRLDLTHGRVARTGTQAASAGLLAARDRRLVLGDAVRTRIVSHAGDGDDAIELPIHGLRAAAFAGPTTLVTLGQRTVARFDLCDAAADDQPAGAERAWTRLFSRLGRQLVVNRAADHIAVAQTDAVAFVELAEGRTVDQMPVPGGIAGVAVDEGWRHWVVWRDGDPAIQRCGRDDRVGRWRFERVPTGTLQPAAVAVEPDGRAWIVDRAGQLGVQPRGGEVDRVADLELPTSARPRRIDLLDHAVVIVCTGRVVLIRRSR